MSRKLTPTMATAVDGATLAMTDEAPAALIATDASSSCPRCGYSGLRHNVLRHLRTVKECPPQTTDSPGMEDARVAFGLPPTAKPLERVACNACTKTFSCKSALRTHVAKSCRGEPPATTATPLEPSSRATKNAKKRRKTRRMRYANLVLPEGVERTHDTAPDIGHITDEAYRKCYKRPHVGLANLVMAIWFDPKHPQNMIYDWIDRNHDRVLKYQRGRWERISIASAIDEMWWAAFQLLEEHVEEVQERRPSDTTVMDTNKVRRYLATLEDDKGQLRRLRALVRSKWEAARYIHCASGAGS
jgi:hypothetical protein